MAGAEELEVKYHKLYSDITTALDTATIAQPDSQSLAAESITFLYFEIEFLFWFYNENTKNIEVLELFVVPNVRSEYSEQY